MRSELALSVWLTLTTAFAANGCSGAAESQSPAAKADAHVPTTIDAAGDTTDVGSGGAGSGGVSGSGGGGGVSGSDGSSGGVAGSAGSGGGGMDGGAGADGAAGTDGAVPCTLAVECPGADTPCSQRTCVNGACGVVLAPAGDATVQTGKDCRKNVCDGNGGTQQSVDDLDLPFDGNACTADLCQSGIPSNPVLPVGASCAQNGGTRCDGAGSCVACVFDAHCDDGLFCNGSETCAWGACLAGYPVQCPDDGFSCTTEACDEPSQSCKPVASHEACQDGSFCNGQELCDPANAPAGSTTGCVPGSPKSCDDGVDCTTDQCDESAKSCTHVPNHAACDDGLFCTVDTCDPLLTGPGCSHAALLCPDADGFACSEDVCSEAANACSVTPRNDLCPTGQLCVPGSGCAAIPCNKDSDCDDGNPCNGVESCQTKLCRAGTPVDCSDGTTCTVDTCDPVGGTCSSITSNALCQDGVLCNGEERCVAGTGCQPGPPHVCENSPACVKRECDLAKDACVPVLADDSACPCGQTCDSTLGCGDYCVVATCQGKVYPCGDCQDNDGDCAVDMKDANCLGPCDQDEAILGGGPAGPPPNSGPCKLDCFFDADSGSGNDDCVWDLRCDPKQPKLWEGCAYDPSHVFPGLKTCGDYQSAQSPWCLSYCLTVTPNGCDCFGCCEIPIPGSSTTATVFIDTRDTNHDATCSLDSLTDPKKCAPCTQVPSCLNACETCELCVGKSELPASCASQVCPGGIAPCGLGQPPCPSGETCITGCCRASPF